MTRNKQGEHIWFELMTPDLAAARAFYEAVTGWSIGGQASAPGVEYPMISAADGVAIGGMLAIDDDMAAAGMKPTWLGYIGVEDVDATAEAIKAAGGSIFVEPRDIPGYGRFAFAADPQGAPFYIMRGLPDQRSEAFAPEKIGHAAWAELVTTDQKSAQQFYMGLFGWEQPDVMPMGPMGDYCFLTLGDIRLGATMEAKDRPPLWAYYFHVPSVAKAVDAIKANGGTITNGPHEVPGGGHIVTGIDPQGAQFALTGKA